LRSGLLKEEKLGKSLGGERVNPRVGEKGRRILAKEGNFGSKVDLE